MKKTLLILSIITAISAFSAAQAEESKDCSIAPEVAKYVEPQLPNDVLTPGETGKVIVKCAISEDGELIGVKTLSSSHEALTEVVMQALEKWEFKAATLNGEPVRATVDIPFSFALAKK